MAQVAVRAVILIRDPGELTAGDPLEVREHRRAEAGEEVVLGGSSATEPLGWLEGSDKLERLQFTELVLASAEGSEEQALEVPSGQNLLLEEGSEDRSISLVE